MANTIPTLRDLRLARGLSQGDLGSRSDIIDLEHGRKLPGVRLINKMAKRLGVATDVVYAACKASVEAATVKA
ncbi:MAG: helix-turn-helix transcriptional regulator [Planctomycetes bacterium]|nr:helix-turn-helix transcriptional regulator [Planctomycetota bacterium]